MTKVSNIPDLICIFFLIVGMLFLGFFSGIFRWDSHVLSFGKFLFVAIVYSAFCAFLVGISVPWKEIFSKRRHEND